MIYWPYLVTPHGIWGRYLHYWFKAKDNLFIFQQNLLFVIQLLTLCVGTIYFWQSFKNVCWTQACFSAWGCQHDSIWKTLFKLGTNNLTLSPISFSLHSFVCYFIYEFKNFGRRRDFIHWCLQSILKHAFWILFTHFKPSNHIAKRSLTTFMYVYDYHGKPREPGFNWPTHWILGSLS